MGKIWSHGQYWDVNEYNRRLSEENKVLYEIEEKREKLDQEEKNRIEEIWK